MEMKKVKYGGNRSKSKPHDYLEALRQEEDGLCEAVLDTLTPDYLHYIQSLVKSSKTPPKKKQSSTNKIVPKQPEPQIKISPKKKVLVTQQNSKDYNITVKRKENDIASSDWKMYTKIGEQQKIRKQTAERQQKYQVLQTPSQSSLLETQNKGKTNQKSQIRFMTNIDQYLLQLQTTKSFRNRLKQSTNIDQRQELKMQNIRLKKKIKQYQQKIEDLQQSVTEHLSCCKKRDKAYKLKINDLVKGLAQAISKINKQKQQIETLTSIFKNFGKRVQQQYHHIEDDSSDQIDQQINESLSKAMKPIRTRSQYKVKCKKSLNSTLKRHQDGYIEW